MNAFVSAGRFSKPRTSHLMPASHRIPNSKAMPHPRAFRLQARIENTPAIAPVVQKNKVVQKK